MNFHSYVTIDDAEHDVLVFFDYQQAESDTNTAASVEVTAAYFEDEGCILDEVSGEELESLKQRCWEHLEYLGEREQAMREDAADSRYQLMKEERRA